MGLAALDYPDVQPLDLSCLTSSPVSTTHTTGQTPEPIRRDHVRGCVFHLHWLSVVLLAPAPDSGSQSYWIIRPSFRHSICRTNGGKGCFSPARRKPSKFLPRKNLVGLPTSPYTPYPLHQGKTIPSLARCLNLPTRSGVAAGRPSRLPLQSPIFPSGATPATSSTSFQANKTLCGPSWREVFRIGYLLRGRSVSRSTSATILISLNERKRTALELLRGRKTFRYPILLLADLQSGRRS